MATGEDRTIVQMIAVPRDALHRLDQGVLYWQNATQFHGTQGNGISLVRMEKVQMFMKLAQAYQQHVPVSYNDFHSNRKVMWKVRIEIYLAQFKCADLKNTKDKASPSLKHFVEISCER